jgi:hypothetical protein
LLEALDIPVKEVTPSQSEFKDSEPDSIAEFTSQESGDESGGQELEAPEIIQGEMPEDHDSEVRATSPETVDRDLRNLQHSVSQLKQNIQMMEDEIGKEASGLKVNFPPNDDSTSSLQHKSLHLVQGIDT